MISSFKGLFSENLSTKYVIGRNPMTSQLSKFHSKNLTIFNTKSNLCYLSMESHNMDINSLQSIGKRNFNTKIQYPHHLNSYLGINKKFSFGLIPSIKNEINLISSLNSNRKDINFINNQQRNFFWRNYQYQEEKPKEEKSYVMKATMNTSSKAAFLSIIPLVISLYFLYQMYGKSGPSPSLYGQVTYEPVKPSSESVRLNDVKGIDDCKEEVAEVIEFLRNRDKYKSIGAKMPKGVLLVGPPGTGKTLLAKAVANESGVNFLYASGSQFDEVLVGVGASRVRSLFASARKYAPCVVFIDELETLGMSRTEFYSNRQTLNQLLAELDGVNEGRDILFIGATNLVEQVDPALLRPGRFDRIINVPLPDIKGRKELFEYYLSKVVLVDEDVSIPKLARLTVGMSGADIENIVNEAAIHAAKGNAPSLNMESLEFALDRGIMGVELKNRRVTDRDLTQTAVHEIGHALVPILSGSKTDIRKVTVIPRGGSVGHTSFLPTTESQFHNSKRNILLEKIDTALGGIIAEEVIFGKNNISIGASSDMKQATNIARRMVSQLGMSEKFGPAVFVDSQQVPISDKIKSEIDKEVDELLKESYSRTKNLLSQHKNDLQKLAEELKKRETLTGNDIREFLGLEKLNTAEDL